MKYQLCVTKWKIAGSVKMWPTMTGGQVVEAANFTVFTVLT
jgi:hypothetical protein